MWIKDATPQEWELRWSFELYWKNQQKLLRMFEAHRTRCKIAAELWNFENVKHFVEQRIGLAIVPRATVRQELADGALVRIPVEGVDFVRRTFMLFRAEGYVSDAAQPFIDLVKQFDWTREQPHSPAAAADTAAVLKAVR